MRCSPCTTIETGDNLFVTSKCRFENEAAQICRNFHFIFYMAHRREGNGHDDIIHLLHLAARERECVTGLIVSDLHKRLSSHNLFRQSILERDDDAVRSARDSKNLIAFA